jgi:hypothetical protein
VNNDVCRPLSGFSSNTERSKPEKCEEVFRLVDVEPRVNEVILFAYFRGILYVTKADRIKKGSLMWTGCGGSDNDPCKQEFKIQHGAMHHRWGLCVCCIIMKK